MQDIDGSPSSKRWLLFILLLMFLIITLFILVGVVPQNLVGFADATQDKLVDLIKWIGGFVASEQITKLAPKKE
jgi:hypothetical protein